MSTIRGFGEKPDLYTFLPEVVFPTTSIQYSQGKICYNFLILGTSSIDHLVHLSGLILHMTIGKLDLPDLINRCEEDISLYFQGQNVDAMHCYELFRRCLQKRDHDAWEGVYTLFGPQVARWVRSHNLFSDSGEEVSYFVNRALEKMWSAIPPDKFARYSNLKPLLSYLKMCVGSAVIDHYRKQERSQLGLEKLRGQIKTNAMPQNLRTDNSQLWERLNQIMKNKKERVVLYASFVIGSKPKEIDVEFSGVFSSVKEIYRIKENILSRLRRDRGMIEFLNKMGEET